LDLIAKGNVEEGFLCLKPAKEFLDKFENDHSDKHIEEISRLTSIVDARHLAENQTAKNFRTSKYGVKMCKYSFELLLYFLQDNKCMLLLRLINQYINIECMYINLMEAGTDKPGTDSENVGTGLVGDYGEIGVDSFNQQEIKLGPLPPELSFLADMERYLAADVNIFISYASRWKILTNCEK
jgi:transcription initiation factor TFIID subunit 5